MKRIGSAAIAGLAVVLLTVPLVCHGSSGSTWHLTVKNPTDYAVRVKVHYAVGWMDEVTIAPDTQHTFDVPGAKCPTGIVGFYVINDHWLSMLDTGCGGNDTPWTCACWTACCWNTTWEVCPKPVTTIDHHLGFCRT